LAGAGLAGLIPRFASAFQPTNSDRVKPVRVPEGGIQPQVVRDEAGTLHLVYYTGDPRAGSLFYTRSKDNGATFAPHMPVNHSGSAIAAGTIRGAQLAVDGNHRPHVAWNGSPGAQPRGPINPDSGKPGEPMLYSRLKDDGSGFEAERNVMGASFGLDGGGSLTADGRGNVHVLWHGIGVKEAAGPAKGEARRQVWTATSHDHGKTFSTESKAWTKPTGACGCCGMKAFTTRKGDVLAMYRSATEEIHRDIYLLHSADQGASFTGRLLHKWDINACPMSSMDFSEGPDGVIAAWETGGQIYWAEVSGKGGHSTEPAGAPGDGKGRKHPRVAINSRGELLLVWTEGTAWQRGGSLAWQVYDRSGKVTNDSGTVPGVPVWSFAAPFVNRNETFSILY